MFADYLPAYDTPSPNLYQRPHTAPAVTDAEVRLVHNYIEALRFEITTLVSAWFLKILLSNWHTSINDLYYSLLAS